MNSNTFLKIGTMLLFLTIAAAGKFGRTLRQEENCPTTEGYYRDEMDCGKFYRCVVLPPGLHADSSASNGRFEFHCPAGTVFDQRFSTCNYPHQVDQSDNCANSQPVAYPPPSMPAPGVPAGSAPPAPAAMPTYPPLQGVVVPSIPDGSYPASGKIILRNPYTGNYGYHSTPVVNRYPANYY